MIFKPVYFIKKEPGFSGKVLKTYYFAKFLAYFFGCSILASSERIYSYYGFHSPISAPKKYQIDIKKFNPYVGEGHVVLGLKGFNYSFTEKSILGKILKFIFNRTIFLVSTELTKGN